MTYLLEIALTNALLATLLAIAVWLITRVWRQPVLVHALWVVVLLKLVTPPLVEVPWRLSIEPSVAAVDGGDGPRPLVDEAEYLPLLAHQPLELDEEIVTRRGPNEPNESMQASVASSIAEFHDQNPRADRPRWLPSISWTSLAVGVWLAGSGLWLVVSIVRLGGFHRALAVTSPPTAELQALADRTAAKLGVAAGYRLRLTDARLSPLVWPLGRPTIVLPRRLLAELTVAEVESLLAHELAHLRRRDHWVRWLGLAVITLYWWHPVVWWARTVLERTAEQACDAWVVWALPRAAERYAATLFKAVQFSSEVQHPLPIVASGIGSQGPLKQRIEDVLNMTWQYRLNNSIRLTLVLSALFILPLSLRAAVEDDRLPPDMPAATSNAPAADEPAADDAPADANETAEERIYPFARLQIQAIGVPVQDPINSLYIVEPGGAVHLGPSYGRVYVAGKTVTEAEAAVVEHLSAMFENPKVQLQSTESRLFGPRILPDAPDRIVPGEGLQVEVGAIDPAAPISGVYYVEAGGTIALGPAYGRVKVAGLTLKEAEAAVDRHLSEAWEDPQVMVTLPRGRYSSRTANSVSRTVAAPTVVVAADTRRAATRASSDEEKNILREHIQFLTEQYERLGARHRARQITSALPLTAGYELAVAQGELALMEGRHEAALAEFEKARDQAEAAVQAVKASYDANLATHGDLLLAAEKLAYIKLRLIRARKSQTTAPPATGDVERLNDNFSEITDYLARAADVMPSTVSIGFLKGVLDAKQKESQRIRKLYEKGEVSVREARKAEAEVQVIHERLRQAERQLEYRRLELKLAELELDASIDANRRSRNSVPGFELARLKIKVEMAELKVRELAE